MRRHALPAGSARCRRTGLPPFVSVITDFTLHRYWVQPRVRTYFAPAPEVVGVLRRRLPHATAIASGIPVAPEFAACTNRRSARLALGVQPDARTILVMGGGFGLGVERAAHAALTTSPDVCVIAVCGRNGSAEARLRALSGTLRSGGADRLHVLGYTTDVPRLMSAADVVVTKPGGLTCSEALAVGRPLVLTRAIPGHEEGNVRYLVARGAAVHAPDEARLVPALRALVGDGSALAAATFHAASAGVPGAARAIAAALHRRFLQRLAA